MPGLSGTTHLLAMFAAPATDPPSTRYRNLRTCRKARTTRTIPRFCCVAISWKREREVSVNGSSTPRRCQDHHVGSPIDSRACGCDQMEQKRAAWRNHLSGPSSPAPVAREEQFPSAERNEIAETVLMNVHNSSHLNSSLDLREA